MTFTVYFPPAAEKGKIPVRLLPDPRLPDTRHSHALVAEHASSAQVVYYLSGLTCTDENVIQKSGIQRKAAQLGLGIVAPDTSPRGLDTPGQFTY